MRMYNDKEDNFNVNLKDLFAECVRKLWAVLGFAIVLAILMAGYKLYNNIQLSKGGANTTAAAELSNQEYVEVSEYMLKVRDMEKLSSYISNSKLMAIDANNIDSVTMQYYVGANENVSNELVMAYQNFILRGGLIDGIAKNYNDIEKIYLQELVNCAGINYQSALKNDVFAVIVYAENKDECLKLAGYVESAIKEYSKNLGAGISEHNLTQLDKVYSKVTDSSLAKKQTDNLDELIETSAEVEDIDDTFTPAQLAKVKELQAKASVGESEVEESQTEEVKNTVSVSDGVIKLFIIGGVAGAFVALAVIVVLYIISGKLKYVDELQVRFGMRSFGNISILKSGYFKKLSDKMFYKEYAFDKEKQEAILLSRINATVKNTDAEELILVGQFDGNVLETVNDVAGKLNSRGVKTEVIGDILCDADAIDKLSAKKNVILVEKLGKSKMRSIKKELLMCDNQNVEVIGYFTIG